MGLLVVESLSLTNLFAGRAFEHVAKLNGGDRRVFLEKKNFPPACWGVACGRPQCHKLRAGIKRH